MLKSSRIPFVQHPLAARREAQPAGVIDTISAGYAALNRQLWVLLLPVLVDLFLWLGPQVSFSPLVEPILSRGLETVRAVSAQSAAELEAADATDLVAQYDTLRLEVMDLVRYCSREVSH
jgi:hypothetical protein